ncbi:hypothetical protein EUTSA_v10005365mg [Eutrema salsugineum]|uniref:Neprosin domain-containing protein n=1 Tax=Eutrema salsugineum TaxID=72664 RepID=V4KLV2_EUTSA|nr:hypothetical protein EUTSA_v10005365mg [Eutrema salsugineum]
MAVFPPSETEMGYGWQIWHQSGTKCPEGSIPIRRVLSHHNQTSSSNSGDRATKNHEVYIYIYIIRG